MNDFLAACNSEICSPLMCGNEINEIFQSHRTLEKVFSRHRPTDATYKSTYLIVAAYILPIRIYMCVTKSSIRRKTPRNAPPAGSSSPPRSGETGIRNSTRVKSHENAFIIGATWNSLNENTDIQVLYSLEKFSSLRSFFLFVFPSHEKASSKRYMDPLHPRRWLNSKIHER